MPRGGARPGTGGARPGAGRPRKKPLVEQAPRPEFASAREFGLWALNAADADVSMDQKIRAMQALLAIDGKKAPDKAEPRPAETMAGGLYAPRSLSVVRGGKK